MTEENIDLDFSDEMKDYLLDLRQKAVKCNVKTSEHANLFLTDDSFIGKLPMRVDDIQLLTIGCMLLPNIVNYLYNIIPQFLYPYVVAYLTDLSSMREDPVTVSELFNYLKENGNIFNSTETEG